MSPRVKRFISHGTLRSSACLLVVKEHELIELEFEVELNKHEKP